MTAGWALQKAVYERLAADAALKALIGEPPRIHDFPSANGPFPFIVFGDGRAARIPGADGLLEHDFRIAIHSRYQGRKEIKEIEAAILAALDDAPLILEGFALVSLRAVLADVFYRAEADAHQGLLRFRAVTERI